MTASPDIRFSRNTPANDLPEELTTDQACQALGIGRTLFQSLKADGVINELYPNNLGAKSRKSLFSRGDILKLRTAKRKVQPRIVTFEFEASQAS